MKNSRFGRGTPIDEAGIPFGSPVGAPANDLDQEVDADTAGADTAGVDAANDDTADAVDADTADVDGIDDGVDVDDADADADADAETAQRPAARRKRPAWRWVGVVVALAVLGAGSGVLVSIFAPPEYTATAQVLVRNRDYASVILGSAAAPDANSPQRVLAAQVLGAQSPQFIDEVARQSGIDAQSAASHLTVTASPDADVLVFSARSDDPGRAVTIAQKAADLEVSNYRNQLVAGLGDTAAGLAGLASGRGVDEQRTFSQVQSFEAISPSAQVIARDSRAMGGPIPEVRAGITGALAGAVVALLLLISAQLWRQRGTRGLTTAVRG